MRSCARWALLCLPLLTAGCASYERSSDFVSDYAGEAMAANRAIQVVTPWPRESFDPHLSIDGRRMEAAVRQYRTPVLQAAAPVRPGSIVISPQN